MARDKEVIVHSMWPKYVKGVATGYIYRYESGHYHAASYRGPHQVTGPSVIFCHNNFVKEGGSRKPVVVPCDKDGNVLEIEFFVTEKI